MPWTINYIFVLIGTFLIAIVTTHWYALWPYVSELLTIPMQDVSIKSPCLVLAGLAILLAFVLATLVFMPMIIHKDIWHVSYIRYILPVVVGGICRSSDGLH